MFDDENNALAGMTTKDVIRFLTKASNVQEALIKLGIEFIEKTGQSNYRMGSFDSWRFEDEDGFVDSTSELGDTYEIVYEDYWQGETEDIPFCIPYRVIDDMNKAVAIYLEEKTRKKEEAERRKLAEEQAIAKEKEQAEYDEYLRLKEKFESQSQ